MQCTTFQIFILLQVCLLYLSIDIFVCSKSTLDGAVLSGLGEWIDPATPNERMQYISSRGDTWNLVMSDEFNIPNRDFRPGKDHIWTTYEKPDGVNHALELYSHNMTSTKCDNNDICYFQIEIQSELNNITIWNDYATPPGIQHVPFYYRAGMMNSWNKFCLQGGMVEVRVQLPGAVSEKSGNPDLKGGKRGRAESIEYYPTWPGIWMMGNLGRALFSASTNRVWPFSYDKCDKDVFEPSNQRISACDENPGHGLNPRQGRGAPEIDILEGGGSEISSSIQLGPGMPNQFRRVIANKKLEKANDQDYQVCMYGYHCVSPGANTIGIPTSIYEKRGHKSWYQGLKYAANNFCTPNATFVQKFLPINASITQGIEMPINFCRPDLCPASLDMNSDLSFLEHVPADEDFESSERWGINANGTCFPKINSYIGSLLCSPGHPAEECQDPSKNVTKLQLQEQAKGKDVFLYQMDAISANWPVHVAAYLDFVVYQLEWVTGPDGYCRWMIEGNPIFEIPAESIVNPPQDEGKKNPIKLMPEEPMYILFNVALSSSWGAKPPNFFNGGCKDHFPWKKPADRIKDDKICDDFPLFMKVDYIRVYQDTSPESKMTVTCDPPTHPTKIWIEDHIDDYVDIENPWIPVQGGAMCRDSSDCTVITSVSKLQTGECKAGRCSCTTRWGGPRCTRPVSDKEMITDETVKTSIATYGPSLTFAILFGIGALLAIIFTAVYVYTHSKQQKVILLTKRERRLHKKTSQHIPPTTRDITVNDRYLVSQTPSSAIL